MTMTHAHPEYTTHADVDLLMAHLDTRFEQLETRIVNMELAFEKTVHAQTRQMFLLLVPVYGGIIVSLLIFLASKVL